MTKRLTLSIVSLLLVILVTAGLRAEPCDQAGPRPASAQGLLPPAPPPPPHSSPGPHAPGMPGMYHPIWHDLASVNLDSKQQQAVDAIRTSMKKSVIRKTADLQITRIELGEVLAADTVDIKTVEEKVRTAVALQADMELSVISAVEAAKALLTPAQKAKLKELHTTAAIPGCPPVRSPAGPGKKDGPAPAQKG